MELLIAWMEFGHETRHFEMTTWEGGLSVELIDERGHREGTDIFPNLELLNEVLPEVIVKMEKHKKANAFQYPDWEYINERDHQTNSEFVTTELRGYPLELD